MVNLQTHIFGRVGGDWRAWASVWGGDWCGFRVSDVLMVHRRQRTRHQPWLLCGQMDRLVAGSSWTDLCRRHAFFP